MIESIGHFKTFLGFKKRKASSEEKCKKKHKELRARSPKHQENNFYLKEKLLEELFSLICIIHFFGLFTRFY